MGVGRLSHENVRSYGIETSFLFLLQYCLPKCCYIYAKLSWRRMTAFLRRWQDLFVQDILLHLAGENNARNSWINDPIQKHSFHGLEHTCLVYNLVFYHWYKIYCVSVDSTHWTISASPRVEKFHCCYHSTKNKRTYSRNYCHMAPFPVYYSLASCYMMTTCHGQSPMGTLNFI